MAKQCPKCGCSEYERTAVVFFENGLTKVLGGATFIGGAFVKNTMGSVAAQNLGPGLFKTKFGQVKCKRCGCTCHLELE